MLIIPGQDNIPGSANPCPVDASCQTIESIDNPFSSLANASLYESPDTLGLERPATADTKCKIDARPPKVMLVGVGLRDVEGTAVAGLANARDAFSAGKDTS